MNLMRGIDLKKIAEKMNGASGAELKVNLESRHKAQYIYVHLKFVYSSSVGSMKQVACFLLVPLLSITFSEL